MALPYPAWNVVYGEIPAASKWSQLGANDDALAAGTGFNAGAIPASALGPGSVVSSKINLDEVRQATNTGTVTISSSTFVNVASTSVTTVVGPSGRVFLNIGGYIDAPSSTAIGLFIIANLTGANVFQTDNSFAPDAGRALRAGSPPNPSFFPCAAGKILNGLTPGTTTFQLQARTAGGSGSVNITNAFLAVLPL